MSFHIQQLVNVMRLDLMETHVMNKLDSVYVNQIMQARNVTSVKMDIMTIQVVAIANVTFMELNLRFVTK